MATYGVLGDIHGNLEALHATLEALNQRGVRRLLCVGDIIGYNADSDACVAVMRNRDARIIAGNHDLIGTGLLGFERCSNKARYSLQQTRRRLKPESADWLKTLPSTLLIEPGIGLVHGGVRDVQLYMTTITHIRRNAELLRADMPDARVCFFGHTHEQRVYEVIGDSVTEQPISPMRTRLSKEKLHFINAGSVDAQRKRNYELAEFAIFNSHDWSVEFVRIPYDASQTEAKAAAAGYRIGPLIDRWYTLKRRFSRALGQISSSRPFGVRRSD